MHMHLCWCKITIRSLIKVARSCLGVLIDFLGDLQGWVLLIEEVVRASSGEH